MLWYFLEYTALGRRLLFVGRSRSVARLSGIRVGRMRWGALVASATIAAAAGVLYAGITGAADPVSGASFLLPAFAAAFLGATSIVPGRFNPWGSFIAVYFLVTGITGLTLFGISRGSRTCSTAGRSSSPSRSRRSRAAARNTTRPER